ncbi:MAG TPA: response regulator [Gammaproteobacteria bacterium]|nr:response regulator [Gammaproteobacteria bacterium]
MSARVSAAPQRNGVKRATPADILVVDDNKANLAAIEVALGDLGRHLVKAESGAEALRQLLSHDFALIILDVQMPGMDGFETARLIRERKRSRHVPIIFVTAYTRDDAEILEGYRLGAADFLFKPIVPEVLRAKAEVFVDLQERTAEVQQQAERLRELERLEVERRITAERERWEADRLRQESRNKDQFLAVLAHELRNPLSPIVTGIKLLEKYGRQHDGLDRVRQMMERQSAHLIRLIDDLLDVARISSGKINVEIQHIDAAASLKQAADSVESLLAEKDHKLTIAPMAEAITVAADADRLTQVIANLLNNAVRYTDQGGRIELSCERDGDEAVIRVKDNGQGISTEMLDKIFEQFVQGDSRGRGLGLGLALVQRLVSMHGGRVRAESDGLGHGSTFSVWIPLAEAAAAKAAIPPAAVLEDAGPLSVVLIEDEADIRDSVAALLQSWGHKVEAAPEGQRGLELIFANKPDVAIIDIAMPGMDGYEVARQVRKQGSHDGMRLIAMTGFGRDEDRQRAFEAGFNEHITKPAKPDVLQGALRRSKDGSSIRGISA